MWEIMQNLDATMMFLTTCHICVSLKFACNSAKVLNGTDARTSDTQKLNNLTGDCTQVFHDCNQDEFEIQAHSTDNGMLFTTNVHE